MSLRIYKYPLAISNQVQEVEMHETAGFLSVQEQNGEIVMWWRVDADTQSIRTRLFQIVGTGHIVPHNCRIYLGTVQMNEFVWHVFEVRP